LSIEEIQKARENLPISAIMLLSDATEVEECFQLFSDALISTNGVIGTKRKMGDPQFVKFYTSNPDMVYASSFPLPRLAGGILPFTLKHIFKDIYGMDIEITEYGKPSKLTFDYCERHLRSLYGGIDKFYMIGDNPCGDIRGANNAGWDSILVRTGLFHEGENDLKDPAKYVVENFKAAIDLIFKQEKR
jgi:HAD superfamily hydrolase (TIGR01456 family)